MSRATRGYAPLFLFLLLSVCLPGCHDKGTGETHDDDTFGPPAAVVFSAPGGEISSLDLENNLITPRRVHDIFSPRSVQVTNLGDRVFLVDGHHQKVAILHLPDLTILDDISMPATPVAIELHPNAGHFYMLTSNSKLWRYNLSAQTLDTLPLYNEATTLALLPPEHRELWVASPICSSIYVVSVAPFELRETLHFSKPPRDIEFAPDGRAAYIALSGTNARVVKLDIVTHDTLLTTNCPTQVREIELSDDQRFLVAVDSAAGSVGCHDFTRGNFTTVQVGHDAGNARFAKNSHRLYVQSMDESWIMVFDLTEDGPVIVDTVQVTPRISCFGLWEEDF